MFGWGREAVQRGLDEARTGERYVERFSERGRHKSEELQPELILQIQALVEPESQADPKFQTPLAFTRITAKAVHEELQKQAAEGVHVPCSRTVHDIMNRMGYRLRRVRKVQSKKKVPETDAIFEHLKNVHQQASTEPETLRISVDTKAKVKIGEFSRGGEARGGAVVRAADHDMHPDALLAPAGILEVDQAQLNLVFGTSRDTSDFVGDCLELWWASRREAYPHIRHLLINLDNGPENASSRTQFMKRMVDFADQHQLTLELAYYPPYHSKYNRGIRPFVHFLDRVYETGVKLTKSEFRSIAERLERSPTLPKWSIIIHPAPG
jgi:hypothetical protein